MHSKVWALGDHKGRLSDTEPSRVTFHKTTELILSENFGKLICCRSISVMILNVHLFSIPKNEDLETVTDRFKNVENFFQITELNMHYRSKSIPTRCHKEYFFLTIQSFYNISLNLRLNLSVSSHQSLELLKH